MEFTFDLELNQTAIEELVEEAFREDLGNLAEGLKETIDNPIWEWSDGELRDIVDTGEFRDNQTVFRTGLSAEIYYDVTYAEILYFGKDNGSYPARPWIKRYISDYYNLIYFEKNTAFNLSELPG